MEQLLYGATSQRHERDMRAVHHNHGAFWTEKDDKTLRHMANYGASITTMASKLLRTSTAIRCRLEKLGIAATGKGGAAVNTYTVFRVNMGGSIRVVLADVKSTDPDYAIARAAEMDECQPHDLFLVEAGHDGKTRIFDVKPPAAPWVLKQLVNMKGV